MFSLPDRSHGVPGEFTYRRCRNCGTVYQDPRVIIEDISLCYPDAYFTHQPPEPRSTQTATITTPQTNLRLRAWIRQVVMAAVRREPMRGATGRVGGLLAKSRRLRTRAFREFVMDELLPFKSVVGRALEVGCGAGQLLKVLHQVGWKAEGFEWDEKAAEIARRTSGLGVTVGDFQTANLPSATYDLVVLNHVLEHLPDTPGCLRKIANILARGGRAVLIYPNVESLGARVFREDWHPWESPRHLVFPTASGLRKAAADAGLITMRLKTSARNTAEYIAYTRRHRKREPINPYTMSIGYQDKLFALYERALMAFGFKLGEELIIVLKKPL
jgi:2-polyprenyl-3-methyl-5-hydroxy-6-metoxy-1,4-benzoquinol methylase